MICVSNLICDFPDGDGTVIRALSVPAFQMEQGGVCALTGPSGSGKSTFLHCLAGLLKPTEGTLSINGVDVPSLSEQEAARWRSAHVGYVFQKSLLLPWLTVMENILLAASLSGKSGKEKEADEWLSAVGLDGYGRRRPDHLSGGEQQRVSFVRAVIGEPDLILADEPTASLDKGNSAHLMKLLLDYQKSSGCTLLCATHDPSVQALFPQQYALQKGGVQ